jgi:hypothetical protein
MKNTPYIQTTFGTKLTVRQLNVAIRLGALLYGGEVYFYGPAGADADLVIKCSELTGLFLVKYGNQCVEFQFAQADYEMLTCIRVILDDDLMFEMPKNLKVQASGEDLSLDRLGA